MSSNIHAAVSVYRCIKIFKLKHTSQLKKRNNKASWFSCWGEPDVIVLVVGLILFATNTHILINMRVFSLHSIGKLTHSEINEKTFFCQYFLLTERHIFTINGTNLTNSTFKSQLICFTEAEGVYYDFTMDYWPKFDMFVYSYIPFGIVLTSTILIMYRIFVHTNQTGTNSKYMEVQVKIRNPNEVASDNLHSSSNTKSNRTTVRTETAQPVTENAISLVPRENRQEMAPVRRIKQKRNQTYQLLILLNIVFFILVGPLAFTNVVEFWHNEYVQHFVYILAYMNNCVNIFFYYLTCECYRNILKRKLNFLNMISNAS